MYYKQFNGIRALAVIAVIIHHWTYATNFLADLTHHGASGVALFFVLSGFLITVIRDKIVVKINFFEKYKSGNYIL